jgi:uncharacterized protein YuzE
MELTYDRDQNIAYLRLKPKGSEVETVSISDQLNVDVAPDGSIYGIEFLNANDQLRSADGGRIVYVDPVSGEERSLKVA